MCSYNDSQTARADGGVCRDDCYLDLKLSTRLFRVYENTKKMETDQTNTKSILGVRVRHVFQWCEDTHYILTGWRKTL